MQADLSSVMGQLTNQYQSIYESNDHFEYEKSMVSFEDDFFTSFGWPSISPFQSPIISPIRPIIKSPDHSAICDNEISDNDENDDTLYHEHPQNANPMNDTSNHTNIVHITQHINNVSIIQVGNEQVNQLKSNDLKTIPCNGIFKINSYKSKNLKHHLAKEKKSRRKNFPDVARSTMKLWLLNHWMNPYPTAYEKQCFARQFNLTEKQVQIFLTNQRVRLLGRKGIRKNFPIWITKK